MEMTVLELWPTDPVAACKRIYFDMYEIRNYVVRSLSACSSEYLKQQGVGTSGDTEAAAALFPVARSDTNSVRVQIMRDTLELPFTLRFRLSAVDAALSDARLRVQYVTPSEGTVMHAVRQECEGCGVVVVGWGGGGEGDGGGESGAGRG